MVTNFGRRFRLTTTSAHWLDYGSVTLAGVPGYLLDRLQSVLYMLQHVWLRESASTIQSLLCFGTCTGCGSQNALNINWPCFNWPCWFTVVVTTPRPSTWPGTSTGSPTMTLDDVCDRQQHSSSSPSDETSHSRRSGLSSRRSSCVECAAFIGCFCSVNDCLQESLKDASVSAAVL